MQSIVALSLLAGSALAAPTLKQNERRWQGASACEYIANHTLADPNDVLSCLRSFKYDPVVVENTLSVAERVTDFYTFETSALESPPPYQESKVDLRAEYERIRNTKYDSDYDFNVDLYFTVNRLNDGHTLWLPYCYVDAWQLINPIPIVSLASDAYGHEEIYVIPDANEFFGNFLDGAFAQHYMDIGLNITRFAGAKVVSIENMTATAYVDKIATEYSGNYLPHDIRRNSVFSSYRLVNGAWGQRLGDFAGSIVPSYPATQLTVTMIPLDSGVEETFTIPYVATFIGQPFTDQASYYEANCRATNTTNGQDYKLETPPTNITNTSTSAADAVENRSARRHAMANLPQLNARSTAIGLPEPFIPSQNLTGSSDVLSFSMLPNSTVGVMMVGSFEPANYSGFQVDILAGIDGLKAQGADHLIIDVTLNGGGYVCDGLFLHRVLAGPSVDMNPGFQSVMRANTLAQQIMAANIAQENQYNLTEIGPNYYPPEWNNLEGMPFGPTDDFFAPPMTESIYGVADNFTQRNEDLCTPWAIEPPAEQPFDLNNVLIVGNGNCASTCASFTTLMYEVHDVKIANFGAAKTAFCAMNGAEVLEFALLDSEVKTANLKSSPLAPPDLLVNANFRHNWRASYSYKDPNVFNPYNNDTAQYNFAYTRDTWNNPQALWTFAAQEVFKI